MTTSPTAQSSPSGDCRCQVCARFPLRPRHFDHLDDCLCLFDNYQGGMFDLRIVEDQMPRVSAIAAEKVAEKACYLLRRLRLSLEKEGIVIADQKFTGLSDRARMMAPFGKEEIVLGPKLGSGGFSSVYELEGFCPSEVVSRDLSSPEQAAREFLFEYAHRRKSDVLADQKKTATYVLFPTTARYAVKQLRRKLTEDEDKFEKAAIDIALEAQLLLSMDHPHIISIRGWSRHGTEAFRTGGSDDFFIIMDCLPSTLEDRIFTWRSQLRKYQSRSHLLWNRKRYGDKIRKLLSQRIQVAHDISTAIEYLHERRVINRDIKTSNIGFDHHSSVKLFDLGLARLLPERTTPTVHDGYLMSRVGTKSTMAPEVRRSEPYSLSADVYSFGVVLWEILSLSTSGDYLGHHLRTAEQNALKADLDKPHNRDGFLPLPICSCWPTAVQTLIRQCLDFDPTKRPSMTDVRQVLLTQMEDLGVVVDGRQPRRRSTFRIDLSGLDFTDAKSTFKGSTASTVIDCASFSDNISAI